MRKIFLFLILILIIGFIFYPEIDESKAEVIKSDLRPTSTSMLIEVDEDGKYKKYFVLHDRDQIRVPLLLKLEFTVNDYGKSKLISESIENFSYHVFGASQIIERENYADDNYYLGYIMFIETNNNELATFKENEAEIAYLDSKFENIKVKKIINKIIKYEIKNGVNSYHLNIEIRRDPVTEELFIEIRDEADVVYVD